MKINRDFPEKVIPDKTITQHSSKKVFSDRVPSDQNFDQTQIQSISNRLNMDRTITDALAISHISQGLIQKALIVSSQLQNMASQALASGKINAEDIGGAISDINNTVGSYDKGVTSAIHTNSGLTQHFSDLPEISEDLKTMKNFALELQNGRPVSAEALDSTVNILQEKALAVGDIAARLFSNIKEIRGSAIGMSQAESSNSVRATGNMILDNPGLSLAAQGNITYDSVNRFLSSGYSNSV